MLWKLYQSMWIKKLIAFLKKLFIVKSDATDDLISEIENQAESVEPFSYGLSGSTQEKEKMSFKLNVSEGKANYSQRKSKLVHEQKGQYGTNIINWKVVCNIHALIMAYLYSGWTCPASAFEREPDAFGDFVIQECLKEGNWFKTKMFNLWNNWYEGKPDAYTPLELHDVLAHYANEWFKCTNSDKFSASVDIRVIFKHIYEDRVAVPTSVQWGGLLGHVVTIVGFEATSEEDLNKWLDGETDTNPITKVIVDDPWGKLIESTNKYDSTQSGNDNEFSYDFFDKHWKGVDNRKFKYAHIIAKPATLV